MPCWWQSLVNCLAKSTRIPLLITGFVSDHEERPAPARSSPVAAPAEFLDIDVDKLARVFLLRGRLGSSVRRLIPLPGGTLRRRSSPFRRASRPARRLPMRQGRRPLPEARPRQKRPSGPARAQQGRAAPHHPAGSSSDAVGSRARWFNSPRLSRPRFSTLAAPE
jgi:hypothetical protein